MAAAPPTMATTNFVDKRGSTAYDDGLGRNYPVWEYSGTGLWDADDTAAGTRTFTINGIIRTICLTVPANTNSVTGGLTLSDAQGHTLWTCTEKAAGSTFVDAAVNIAVTGVVTLTYAISGAAGTTGITLTATVRGE